MKTKKKFDIKKAVAYWNVEHTPEQRKAHLDQVNEIISLLGYDDVLDAKDVSLPDWDNKPDSLGFPATRIDVVLKPNFRGHVWREAGTGGRVKWLTTLHLTFRLNAGVEDGSPKLKRAKTIRRTPASVEDALKISRWRGWDGTVAEYSMVTDGEWCAKGCRTWCGYNGRNDLGDSFGFAETFDGLRSQLATMFRHVVEGLGMKQPR